MEGYELYKKIASVLQNHGVHNDLKKFSDGLSALAAATAVMLALSEKKWGVGEEALNYFDEFVAHVLELKLGGNQIGLN